MIRRAHGIGDVLDDVCGIISYVCSKGTRSYVCVLSDFMCVCVCASKRIPFEAAGTNFSRGG